MALCAPETLHVVHTLIYEDSTIVTSVSLAMHSLVPRGSVVETELPSENTAELISQKPFVLPSHKIILQALSFGEPCALLITMVALPPGKQQQMYWLPLVHPINSTGPLCLFNIFLLSTFDRSFILKR